MTKTKTFLASILLIVLPLLVKAQWALPTNTELPAGSVFGIVGNIMFWILGLLGIVAIIGFVISGIMYFLAAGDEKKIETAKSAMVASITGAVVGLIGYVILQAVEAMLGGDSVSF